MNTTIQVVLGLLVGIGLTLGIHRAGATRPGTPARPVESRLQEREALQRECEELRKAPVADPGKEIAGLETKIRELEAKKAAPVKNPKIAIAERLLKYQSNLLKGIPDTEAALKTAEWIMALDETVASFLIGEFRKRPAGNERNAMASFIFQCGGADVAAFLKQWLDDASVTDEERGQILAYLGSAGKKEPGAATTMENLASIRPVPMDEDLARRALALVQSPKTTDRAGGAGLLAGQESAESRNQLVQLAGSGPESSVRAAAVTSLGCMGDRSTIPFLEALPLPPEVDLKKVDWKDAKQVAEIQKRMPDIQFRGAVKRAIESLKKKFKD